MDIKNKQIVILGLGGSGEAAARLALQQGGKVFVFDEGRSETVLDRAQKLIDLGANVECGCQTAPQIKAD
ncbi:MAG: UDP-N-acetylmuramoyl-L-alanine--D-glutamate ligase, partial [Verrucomicrobia bacterium]|nr:UDP-N-acetylmuramoyl-L-alanine--D-glutamate ligase [Verrucomicrobiota bacterium]